MEEGRGIMVRGVHGEGGCCSAHDNVRSSDNFRVIMPRDRSISYLRG